MDVSPAVCTRSAWLECLFLFCYSLLRWMRQMSLPAFGHRVNRRLMLLKKVAIGQWTEPAHSAIQRDESQLCWSDDSRGFLARHGLSAKARLSLGSSKHFWLPLLLAPPWKDKTEDNTVESANPRPQQVRHPGRFQTEPRQPSSLQVESWSMVQVASRERCSRLRARGDTADPLCVSLDQTPPLLSTRPWVSQKTTVSVSRAEAQNHWERLVITKLGDTSRPVTDLTKSWHLNFHIRLSVAEAAARTLCKHFQQWTSWCEWALEHGNHSLHEVITGEAFLLFFPCRCLETHHSCLSHAALQHANSPKGEMNGHPPQGCQPKNWRATIPKTCGRPTQELAGTNPRTGKQQYSSNSGVRRQALPVTPLRAGVHLPRRSRVRVRCRSWGRDGKRADDHFLPDADPTSHRVRRGSSSTVLAADGRVSEIAHDSTPTFNGTVS